MADDTKIEEKVFPIKYYGNENITGVFADQVVVSNLGGIFTLYFYQMQVPAFIGDPDSLEFKSFQKETSEVPARCVARVVLTPVLMEQFAKAITKNLEKYKRLLAHESDETEK